MSRPLEPAQPVLAVGAVCLRDNNVLLVRRAKPPRKGRWSLPGGHLEWGETAAGGAQRELAEETGVEAEGLGLIDVVDVISDAHHYVVIDYAFRWTAGEPRANDDALEARFVPLTGLEPYYLSGDTLSVIAKALRQFGA
ncbi:MAG: NUDIX hydrolase [Pseudomonadota bacterium]